MDRPLYAVCQQCEFLRGFAAAARGRAPERCPVCGSEVRVHRRRERFPSTHVGRISRELHRIPPLGA